MISSHTIKEQTPRLLISLVFTTLFFLLWPTNIVVDDAGIILKYMDNFAAGYFYSYNPADGPIYGISGFVHGVLAGTFAYLHIFSPLNSLFASNFIGVFLLSFLTINLLSFYSKNHIIIYASWILIMLSRPNVLIYYKQGLETPLHLAIVILCFLFYLNRRSRLMWLSFALAIISKLDAIPIVVVLIFAYLIRNQISSTPHSIRQIGKNALLYFILPGVLWIIFTYIVFEGPFPQTALAKMFYQTHPSDYWFPFIREMEYYNVNLISLVLWTGFLAWCLIKRKFSYITSTLIFGFTLLSYFFLFYVYNPAEKMRWYYAIPEFLIILQLTVIIIVFLEQYSKKFKVLIAVVSFFFLGYISVPKMITELQYTFQWLLQVEGERMAIGTWIHNQSNPDDKLASGHGHIARNSGLYNIDLSGLNSKIITDYNFDCFKVFNNLKPRWIVFHGLYDVISQLELGYDLVNSHYNVSAYYWWSSWRIYERSQDSEIRVGIGLESSTVKTGDILERDYLLVEGETVIFQDVIKVYPFSEFVVGLARGDQDLLLKASFYDANQSLLDEEEMILAKRDEEDPVGGLTSEWDIPLQREWDIQSIEISAVDRETKQPRIVRVVEPMFVASVPMEEVRKNK